MKIKGFKGMVFWGLAASVLMIGNVIAAEVLLEDVIEKNIRVEEVFEKVTDNIVVLFDASGSMAQPYKDTGMAKVEIAKRLLKDRGQIPELGYNAGLYTFTPWETYYEMQPYDQAKMAAAIDQVPASNLATRATPLGQGIQNLGPILDGVSGNTTVEVSNVAPTPTALAATAILEYGTTMLSGTIGDVGTLDTFKIGIASDRDRA